MPESFAASQFTPTAADRHAALFTHHNRPPILLTIEVLVPSGTTDGGVKFPGSYVVPMVIETGRLSAPGAGAPYSRTVVVLGRPNRSIKVPTQDNAGFNEEMLAHPDSTVVRGEDGNYWVCPPGWHYVKGAGLVEDAKEEEDVKEEDAKEEVKAEEVKTDIKSDDIKREPYRSRKSAA